VILVSAQISHLSILASFSELIIPHSFIFFIYRDGNFCPTRGYPTLMGRVLPDPIRNKVEYGF